jgi:hypothetical protein
MAEPKTRPTTVDPRAFIGGIVDDTKRDDSIWLLDMMARVTGEKPVMWGDAIIGYGTYRFRGSNGKEMDWPMAGFSPRKQNLTLYLMPGFQSQERELQKLGPHTTGVSCLYVKTLAQVDREVLSTLVKTSTDEMRARTKNGTVALVSVSEYATSDAKKRADARKSARTTTKKSATKKSATKKSATKKSATKKSATKKSATKSDSNRRTR